MNTSLINHQLSSFCKEHPVLTTNFQVILDFLDCLTGKTLHFLSTFKFMWTSGEHWRVEILQAMFIY